MHFKKVALIFGGFLTIFTVFMAPLGVFEPVVHADAPVTAGKLADTTIRGTQTMTFGSGVFTPTAWVYLPLVLNGYPPAPPAPTCPTTSTRSYDLIPVPGNPADHPDYLHGDLNLSLRGWEPVDVPLGLVNYNGGSDPNSPDLRGIFGDNRVPAFTAAYQVYGWDWGCGSDGCRGGLLGTWPATLLEMETTAGETLHIPSRAPDIYQGNYRALVLYAEENRITLVYAREDTVAFAYSVHLEDVCVDPNLLALYRTRVDANGWRINDGGYQLPALNNGQVLGTAAGSEIKVAIRDRGAFMDPRSAKDWWQ